MRLAAKNTTSPWRPWRGGGIPQLLRARPLRRPCSQWSVPRAAVLAPGLLGGPCSQWPVPRAAALAPGLRAPVLAVARAAVLAAALPAPVLAVCRAAVPALVLVALVLALRPRCFGLAVGLACSQSQNPQKISKHSEMVCLGLVCSGIWLGVAGTAFWPPPRFPADAPSTARSRRAISRGYLLRSEVQ
jgi:hypothetical protein